MAKTGIVRTADEGEKRWFHGGGLHVWKAKAEETAGALFAFEDRLVCGKLTPLHRHPDADESLYVLEGEIAVVVGDTRRELGPGGFTFTPRGMAHALSVVSPTATVLTIHTPGTGEDFYFDASEPTDATAGAGPVDYASVGEAAKATGATEILGPPPFEQLRS